MSPNRFLLPLLLMLAGCASAPLGPTGAVTTWSGKVVVEETVKFERGQKLVVEPGTTVVFAKKDADKDGLGDVSLVMEGDLVARGTPDKPILFTSGDGTATPGDWGEIRIDFGSVDLSYAIVEGSTRGLHLHFTSGQVADSIFRENIDGTRIGESRLRFSRCLFSGQEGKGYNARTSENQVEGSWFRRNKRGVFLFEGDKGSRLTQNRFSGNFNPFRLGDFFVGTFTAADNRWDDPPTDYRAEGDTTAILKIEGDKPVGRVGPRGWPLYDENWSSLMEGFVDSSPLAEERGVFFADWGGNLKRLGFFDGRVLAQAKVGDVTDAPLASNGRFIAVHSWDRKLRVYSADTLQLMDEFAYVESKADDHRQSGPLFSGDKLYLATWSGDVYCFEVSGEGKLRQLWKFSQGAPFRADLSLGEDGGALLAPSSSGTLFALNVGDGKVRWEFKGQSPFLSGASVSRGVVFAAEKNGLLHALNLADGRELWLARVPGEVWYSQPGDAGELILQGDDGGNLSALKKSDGSLVWLVKLDGGIRSRPLVADGLASVVTLGGSVYLVRTADGFIMDRLKLGEPLLSGASSLGNNLYLGGRDEKARSLSIIK